MRPACGKRRTGRSVQWGPRRASAVGTGKLATRALRASAAKRQDQKVGQGRWHRKARHRPGGAFQRRGVLPGRLPQLPLFARAPHATAFPKVPLPPAEGADVTRAAEGVQGAGAACSRVGGSASGAGFSARRRRRRRPRSLLALALLALLGRRRGKARLSNSTSLPALLTTMQNFGNAVGAIRGSLWWAW